MVDIVIVSFRHALHLLAPLTSFQGGWCKCFENHMYKKEKMRRKQQTQEALFGLTLPWPHGQDPSSACPGNPSGSTGTS